MKLYFALNGAVHDAAVAAWGVKGYYDSVRPISMIRYMGGKGQSSDPDGPSYDPSGLPLVPGLVEVITAESSAPGERHAHLADHVGEIAIHAWRATPRIPTTQTQRGGLDPRGRLGAVPAADVRHAGVRRLRVGPQHVQPRRRRGDDGVHRRAVLPRRPVRVDRAGRRPRRGRARASDVDAAVGDVLRRRRPGRHLAALRGHPHPADDFEGRKIGSIGGQDAWALAQRYFDGTAR